MKIAVISIALIVLAVVLYSIFGKTTTTSSHGGGGGTQTHGGALTWLQNILNGVHIGIG